MNTSTRSRLAVAIFGIGLVASLALAVQPAHADPTPFTVDADGITYPSGFADGGHVNINPPAPAHNLDFQSKCATRTDFECDDAANGTHLHADAQYIGATFVPWSAFGLVTPFCVSWVQVSGESYHFGEHGEAPVCSVTPTSSPTPTSTPTVEPMPTATPSEHPGDDTPFPTPAPTRTAKVVCPWDKHWTDGKYGKICVLNETATPMPTPSPSSTLGTPPRVDEPDDTLADTGLNGLEVFTLSAFAIGGIVLGVTMIVRGRRHA